MSGRGDNNKHGSSGRGASNQSNQGAKDESQQISENIQKVQQADQEKNTIDSGSDEKQKDASE